jgi:hypothetical protein
MTTTQREFATYKVEVHGDNVEVEVEYTGSVKQYNGFQSFGTQARAYAFIDKNEKVSRVIQIMAKYTQEMENYGYYGSNPGIKEDEYDEIAEEIVAAFGI